MLWTMCSRVDHPKTDSGPPPDNRELNLNTPSSTSAAPVFLGEADPSTNYLPVIEAMPSHFDHGVQIYDSSPPVVVPAMYPAMSCVTVAGVTWSHTAPPHKVVRQNLLDIFILLTEPPRHSNRMRCRKT